MLERRVSTDGIVFYVSPLLESAGVVHGFSTRIGGVSPQPFDSLNLGNPSGTPLRDEDARIHENYKRLEHAVGFERDQVRCRVHQVHGGHVVRFGRGSSFTSGALADAMITDDPQKILSIRFADCVPVLLSSADGRTVAAIHAGWRGIVARVVANALCAIEEHCGASDLIAAIGPCIGFDAFQVSNDVLRDFTRALGHCAPIRRTADCKGYVDLRQAVKMQLELAGVPSAHIDTTDRCTYRDRDEFFSHRRDSGLTGRMAALIAPKG